MMSFDEEAFFQCSWIYDECRLHLPSGILPYSHDRDSEPLGGSVPGPLGEPKASDFVVPELLWDPETPTDLPLGSPTTNKGLSFF